MQKFHYQLDEQDRRIVRKWRLASVGFYGSIIVGMIVFAALHGSRDVNYASVESVRQATGLASAKP